MQLIARDPPINKYMNEYIYEKYISNTSNPINSILLLAK